MTVTAATPDQVPGGDDDDNTVSVADPEDYVQTRRLREIHDARERVPTTIREESDRIGEDITQERYREIITDTLVDYIIEVEPLLRDEQLDLEEDYWSDVGISVAEGETTLEEIVNENGAVSGDGGSLTVEEVRNAFRVVNRFLYDADLDLETEQGLPEDTISPET